MKSVKIKNLIENHSVIENEELYELRKRSQQFTDICNIMNYDCESNDAQRIEKIQYIIFNIGYRKDVLSKIEK